MPTGDVPDATTVSDAVAAYREQGYVMSFFVQAGGMLRCGACRTASAAETMPVIAIARTEGPSDPADMALVAVVTCPWCSISGVAVLGYGPSASLEDAEVLERLNDDRPEGEPAVLRATDPPPTSG